MELAAVECQKNLYFHFFPFAIDSILFKLACKAKQYIYVFPVSRPTLTFSSDYKVLIGFKKMKFYHMQPTLLAANGFATFAVIFFVST